MSMNLKLKDMWYWIANFALLGSAFISMYVNNALRTPVLDKPGVQELVQLAHGLGLSC